MIAVILVLLDKSLDTFAFDSKYERFVRIYRLVNTEVWAQAVSSDSKHSMTSDWPFRCWYLFNWIFIFIKIVKSRLTNLDQDNLQIKTLKKH